MCFQLQLADSCAHKRAQGQFDCKCDVISAEDNAIQLLAFSQNTTYTLENFMTSQKNQTQLAFDRISSLRSTIVDLVWESCAVSWLLYLSSQGAEDLHEQIAELSNAVLILQSAAELDGVTRGIRPGSPHEGIWCLNIAPPDVAGAGELAGFFEAGKTALTDERNSMVE